MIDLDNLKKTTQKNCDLVDSECAQNYGLCVFLLKMREYFRWKNGISLTADIRNDEILPWMAELEEYWEKIEGEPFEDFVINKQRRSPFESEAINKVLNPQDLVYSAGYGYGGVPLFFLARLEKMETLEGFSVLVSSEELSRGLYGAPAMLQGRTIFVRREALRNLLWARYDEWRFSKRANTKENAFKYYDFQSDPDLALEQMTNNELNTLIFHEIGEGKLEKDFGPEWRDMLVDFTHTKTEYIARAVRDLASDCLSTLPYLMEENRQGSIHFYFANFSDMRKELFPELYQAYRNWSANADFSPLLDQIEKGKIRWLESGLEILELYRSDGKSAGARINATVGQ